MYALKQRPQSGFTIVELLIVIVVIGILAAITVVAFNGVQQKAKIAVVQSDLNQASKTLGSYKATSADDTYPADLAAAKLSSSSGTTYQYTYTSPTNSYCLTGTLSGLIYMITSMNTTPTTGACTGHVSDGGSTGPTLPAGYETAPIASGAQTTTFDGYKPVQPSSCPTTGGLWVKVPGNSLYGTDNGFCVQQYPARNTSNVATSSATGARWTGTGVNQATAKTFAETAATGSHLFSENEWMTIATNAAAQPQNWSGGSVGSGTLTTGSTTAAYGGVSVVLSNGERIYFDTGTATGYAANEFTCYTGALADNCGLAAQSLPVPGTAYYTDQFTLFTSYGALNTNTAGQYYGDPRFSNPTLSSYVTSARNAGLGYLRSGYVAGSTTLYAFIRSPGNGVVSSGLFSLYANSSQTYAHAQYGFRAAK